MKVESCKRLIGTTFNIKIGIKQAIALEVIIIKPVYEITMVKNKKKGGTNKSICNYNNLMVWN